MGALPEAITALRRLLEVDPSSVQGRLDLARLLSTTREQHAEALALLNQALERMTDDDPMRSAVSQKIADLQRRLADDE